MNPSHSRLARLGLRCAGLTALVLAGCNIVPPAQEDATRYFVLSDGASVAADASQVPAAPGLRLGLKAIRLERYLKDRPMVVRRGPNEVQFEDFRLWAEPLDAGIARTLRLRLLAAPGVSQVFLEPFPFDQARDFDVSVEVTRFEGSASAGKYEANLRAVVEVSTSGANGRVVSRRIFDAPAQSWDGADFDRLAALLSEDVDALAREIVSELPPKELVYLRAAAIRSRARTTFSRLLKALMRTWPWPHLPKPAPGVHTTWAFSSSRSKNSHESRPTLTQM